MTIICSVCKKPIDESLAIPVQEGHVHPGECLSFLENYSIKENQEDDFLNEVQLL